MRVLYRRYIVWFRVVYGGTPAICREFSRLVSQDIGTTFPRNARARQRNGQEIVEIANLNL